MEIIEEDLIKLESILNEIIHTGRDLQTYLEFPLNDEYINYLVIIPHISTIKSLTSFLRIEMRRIFEKNIREPIDLFDLEFDLRNFIQTEKDINNIEDELFLKRIIQLLSELNKDEMINELLEKANEEVPKYGKK